MVLILDSVLYAFPTSMTSYHKDRRNFP
jgi:hypothetical protein